MDGVVGRGREEWTGLDGWGSKVKEGGGSRDGLMGKWDEGNRWWHIWIYFEGEGKRMGAKIDRWGNEGRERRGGRAGWTGE